MAKKIRPGSTFPNDLFPEGTEDGWPGAYVIQSGRLEQGLGPAGAQDIRALGPVHLHLGHHDRPAKSCVPVDTQPVQLLDPLAQPRFVNDLPLPERIDASEPGATVSPGTRRPIQARHSWP